LAIGFVLPTFAPTARQLFAAQRPKGLVNGHIADPVVIEFPFNRATASKTKSPSI
jgi:hypothetical protein